MQSIDQEVDYIKSQGLYRKTRLISSCQSAYVTIDGSKVLMLCSNNYLGLAEHPLLCKAAIEATENFGTSSGASRLVSGTMNLHEQLEAEVASFKQTEAALVFNSGYAANTGIISALVGRGDVIFSDRLNHASIIDGAILSGARFIRYLHNDPNSLEKLLIKHRGNGRSLIVTDGVFSMDGDVALFKELVALKQKYNSILMVDDAHGCAVLGDKGRGGAEASGVLHDIDIHMGTFGKALGSFGAYAAVSTKMREYLLNKARTFIFSTSLPPSVLAASIAALKLVQSTEGDKLRESLKSNRITFRNSLLNGGFMIGHGNTQIVPILTGKSDITMQFSEQLLKEGVFVQGIRPPTVPNNACRLRCTLMATHSVTDIDMATEIIISIGRRLGVI